MSKAHAQSHRKNLPRLVIADDDPVVRAMVIEQLRKDFDCVGEASDAAEAVAVVAAQHPDVAILDVDMPAGGAGRATRQICEQFPGTAVVILSIDETWAELIDLLNAGAMTYLRKGVDEPTLARDLKSAIEAHGRRVYVPAIVEPDDAASVLAEG
jgi:DNA-binding NarL/FixJ family response regulator